MLQASSLFFELIALRLVMWSEGAGGGREFFLVVDRFFLFCDEIVVSEEIKLKFSQIPPQPAPV